MDSTATNRHLFTFTRSHDHPRTANCQVADSANTPSDITTVTSAASVPEAQVSLEPEHPLLDNDSPIQLERIAPNAPLTQWKNLSERSLDSLLMSQHGFQLVTNLKGESAVAVADAIDEILESQRLSNHRREQYIAVLCKLCGNCGILPTSLTITDGLNNVGELPIAGGGFAEVWEGRYRGRRVALKVLKLYSMSDQAELKKRFCKEALIWRRLSHPNVLPFIGVAQSPFKFCMASPWMVNGNVIVYLQSHPEANPVLILREIIEGLAYLHSMNIVHGDFKGANILMNEDGQACLADFGLTTIICDTIPGYSITTLNWGTVRWMAPELFMPEQYGLSKSVVSKESDIYAFGMVIYEVITKTIPFSQYCTMAVVPKVITGVRPKLLATDATTTKLVDAVWPLAEECWHQKWDQRPSSRQVLERLNLTASRWSVPELLPEATNSVL